MRAHRRSCSGTGICRTRPARNNNTSRDRCGIAQVIPAITHTPFTEILFSNIGHITGIPGPVRAAVDQQDIKWLAIMGELGPVRFLNKFMGRAVAYGATLWRLFTCKDKTTDGASPRYFRVCVTLGFLS